MKTQVTKTAKTTTTAFKKKAATVAPATITTPAPAAPAPVAEPVNKRITPGTVIAEYRIVRPQRKAFIGYYVQGGAYRKGALTRRDRFDVAVEIPHADLAAAKAQLASLHPAAKTAA